MAYSSQQTFNQTAAAAVLKTKYEKMYNEMTFEAGTLFALMPKDENAEGDKIRVPVTYGNPTAVSNTGATVLTAANGNASRWAGFDVTLSTKYGRATVDDTTVYAAKNQGAIIDAMESEMRKVMREHMHAMSIDLYRNGGGARGRISATSNPATPTITLANTNDIVNFSIGQILQVSDTDGTSGALRVGSVEVAGIDRDLGTITATGNWTAGIAAAVANDYVFAIGDFGTSIKGLASWIPTSAPSSTAFFGVDRTLDVTRLGGVRYAAANASLDEALVKAMHRVAREGGRTTHVFMNPVDRAALAVTLGTKVQYNRVESSIAGLGFKTIQIEGENGPVDVFSDRYCPQGTVYGLQMNTWKIYSLGKIPRILDADGNVWRANGSDMAFSIRIGAHYAAACNAPGFNFVLTGWS